ncbi:MAG: efflux RND transporter periplasmic adaptor subunit [Planctomycetota bacterium]|nr:efflux RND transporter periplasmic adaptor subunit [Planctomycetota bacterium]
MTNRADHTIIPAGLALLLTCAAVAAVGCKKESGPSGGGPPPRDAAPVAVSLVPVERRDVERTVDVTGTLFADEDVIISAKVAGRLRSISVDVGDEIHSAEPLAQVEPIDYALALEERRAAAGAVLARIGLSELPGPTFDVARLPLVEKARAETANAEERFRRASQLFEASPPLISEQDYADIRTTWETTRQQAEVELLAAQATLAEAQAQFAAVALAEQRLRDTTVRAPVIAGREQLRFLVAERRVSVGEYVTDGDPLFRLISSDLIKFRAQVPERFAGRVQVGQSVAVATDAAHAGQADQARGVVVRISPAVDPASRSFLVEIHVPNADRALKPGSFARGSIVTHVDEGVAFVPAESLVSFAGVTRIYSVSEGKAVEHRVQPGDRQGAMVEIAGGTDLDRVVGPEAAQLTPGTPVTARP